MKDKTILVTTTQGIDGRPAVAYLGLVSGQAVYGANFMKDFFAGIRDVIGGRSGSYEKVLRGGREAARKRERKGQARRHVNGRRGQLAEWRRRQERVAFCARSDRRARKVPEDTGR